ncbi:MAG: ATP-binding protein [Candidatus Rokuibacteriota bacterium]
MNRLHFRIYLHFLGVLLVVGLLATLVFTLGARGGPWRDMIERVARHVASLIGEAWGDQEALIHRLQHLHDDLEIDMILQELDGRVVAKVGGILPALTPTETAEVNAGRMIVSRHPAWVAAPVRDTANQVVGIVRASSPGRLGPPTLLRPLLVVAAVLLIVALATLPLARRIARPLERLTEAARRVGGGELGYRVPVASEAGRQWWRRRARAADELALLTRAFNEMAERVERTVRGQRELLTNVSHELRSPLTRLRLALELLPRGDESAVLARDVERDFAERDGLIDDVLTTARLEATGLPAHLSEVDAQHLLREVAERARRHPLTERLAIVVAGDSEIRLIADEALLRRALWNLVENAGKYGAPPITLTAARAGDQIRLSVTDDGPGISAADRERVLAPFVRLDSARTPRPPSSPRQGVGLGLTLVRRVAEVHGGSVLITAAVIREGQEQGCRVTIALPVEEAG